MHDLSQAEKKTRALAPQCAQYQFDTTLNSNRAWQMRVRQPAGGKDEDAASVKNSSAQLLEQ